MTLRLSPHTLAMDSGRVQMCSATAPVSQDGRTVSVRWWPKPDRVLPCALTRARRNLATLCSQPSPSKYRSRQCGQATAPKHINIATLCATVHRGRAEQKNTHLIATNDGSARLHLVRLSSQMLCHCHTHRPVHLSHERYTLTSSKHLRPHIVAPHTSLAAHPPRLRPHLGR